MKNRKLYITVAIVITISLTIFLIGFYAWNVFLPVKGFKNNAIILLETLSAGDYENAALVFTTPDEGGEGGTGEKLPDEMKQQLISRLNALENEGITFGSYDVNKIEVGNDDYCVFAVNIEDVEVSTREGTKYVDVQLYAADGQCPPDDRRYQEVRFFASDGSVGNEMVERLNEAFEL